MTALIERAEIAAHHIASTTDPARAKRLAVLIDAYAAAAAARSMRGVMPARDSAVVVDAALHAYAQADVIAESASRTAASEANAAKAEYFAEQASEEWDRDFARNLAVAAKRHAVLAIRHAVTEEVDLADPTAFLLLVGRALDAADRADAEASYVEEHVR